MRPHFAFILATLLTIGGASTLTGQTVTLNVETASDKVHRHHPKPHPTPTPPAGDPDGTWTKDGDGNWSATANWLGGVVADGGGKADFSTLNITGNRTVT